MYLTQPLHRHLRDMPQAVASTDGVRSRHWAALGERVARLAGALRSLGVAPGDRVAMLAKNGDRYMEYVLGTVWAGGAINPVNIRWSAPEIAFSLRDCGTNILIVDDAFLGLVHAIRAEMPDLGVIIHAGDADPGGLHSFDALIEAADPVADAMRRGDDLAAIMYTGGTTGRPKGVMLSHRGLMASGLSYAGSESAPGEAILHAAPMFHVAGISTLVASLLRGTRHVFIPGFDPQAVIETASAARITDLFLVPTMLHMVLEHPALASHDLTCLERILYGASPMPGALLDRAMAAFPKASFTQAYGMTELSPIATLLGPSDHSQDARASGRIASAGKATMVCEVRIVDAEGAEAPRGMLGEIAARGANVMLGYWNRPVETAAAIRDGWMHTGDIGRMDADGYVYVVDRLKDMIISGGENIYSAEVENALASHPAVSQCAVIGIPHEQWGESVHAIIVLRPGHDGDDEALAVHCRAHIAGFKVPRGFEYRETLPLSGAGKILKSELRAPFWEGKQQKI